MRRKLLPVVALGIALLMTTMGHAAHSETRTYITGANAALDPTSLAPSPVAIGGGRFDIAADETVVDLVTADQVSGNTASFAVQFKDAANNTISSVNFCGSATLDVPDGGVAIFVIGNSTAAAQGACANAAPTTGTITATFS